MELKKVEIGRAAAENGSNELIPSGVEGLEPIVWAMIDARSCAGRGDVAGTRGAAVRDWLLAAEEMRAG